MSELDVAPTWADNSKKQTPRLISLSTIKRFTRPLSSIYLEQPEKILGATRRRYVKASCSHATVRLRGRKKKYLARRFGVVEPSGASFGPETLTRSNTQETSRPCRSGLSRDEKVKSNLYPASRAAFTTRCECSPYGNANALMASDDCSPSKFDIAQGGWWSSVPKSLLRAMELCVRPCAPIAIPAA